MLACFHSDFEQRFGAVCSRQVLNSRTSKPPNMCGQCSGRQAQAHSTGGGGGGYRSEFAFVAGVQMRHSFPPCWSGIICSGCFGGHWECDGWVLLSGYLITLVETKRKTEAICVDPNPQLFDTHTHTHTQKLWTFNFTHLFEIDMHTGRESWRLKRPLPRLLGHTLSEDLLLQVVSFLEARAISVTASVCFWPHEVSVSSVGAGPLFDWVKC